MASVSGAFDGVAIARSLLANNDLVTLVGGGARPPAAALHLLQQVPAQCAEEPDGLLRALPLRQPRADDRQSDDASTPCMRRSISRRRALLSVRQRRRKCCRRPAVSTMRHRSRRSRRSVRAASCRRERTHHGRTPSPRLRQERAASHLRRGAIEEAPSLVRIGCHHHVAADARGPRACDPRHLSCDPPAEEQRRDLSGYRRAFRARLNRCRRRLRAPLLGVAGTSASVPGSVRRPARLSRVWFPLSHRQLRQAGRSADRHLQARLSGHRSRLVQLRGLPCRHMARHRGRRTSPRRRHAGEQFRYLPLHPLRARGRRRRAPARRDADPGDAGIRREVQRAREAGVDVSM